MFLISTFAPNSAAPGRRSEMFASQRNEPFSISAVETPR